MLIGYRASSQRYLSVLFPLWRVYA